MAMTPDEARNLIIECLNYAAYRETNSSLHDTDKNRLWGSERYNSGRHIANPSPWAEGDFEEKMTILLRWANILNHNLSEFQEAQDVLTREETPIGRIIRRYRNAL